MAKAYKAIMDSKTSKYYGDLGFKSFFDDFEKQVDEMFNISEKEEQKKLKGKGAEKSSEVKSAPSENNSWG